MTREVAGVVLAAGLSRRMGAVDKLLLDVEGAPMVRGVVEVALRAGLAPVVVVVGPSSSGAREALSGLPVAFAVNARPEDGLSSSLRTGIDALGTHSRGANAGADRIEGAAILLGDMPWVTEADVIALVQAYDPAAGRDICVPVHAGKRGNPVLWGRSYFAELASLEGDHGARRFLDVYAARLREVIVNGDGVLRDVDTPEALATPPAPR